MTKEIMAILRQQGVIPHAHAGVLVCRVPSEMAGVSLAANILYSEVDTKTALYLSGGRTPRDFYQLLAREEKLFPGAVGLIDERYGAPYHEQSNELLIQSVGLLRYLQMRDIRFCPILRSDATAEETSESYDALVRSLHSTFPKSVGVLGIGVDGHTAGIPAAVANTNYPFSPITTDFVTYYNYVNTPYGERVTMTFLGLSVLDFLLVLVFGSDKKQALQMVFSEGSEEAVPGRFYKRPDIAMKTILITDQLF